MNYYEINGFTRTTGGVRIGHQDRKPGYVNRELRIGHQYIWIDHRMKDIGIGHQDRTPTGPGSRKYSTKNYTEPTRIGHQADQKMLEYSNYTKPTQIGHQADQETSNYRTIAPNQPESTESPMVY